MPSAAAFADLIGPWLVRRHGPAGQDHALLQRLGWLAAPVLSALLDRRRTLPPLARLLEVTPPTAPREAYQALVAEAASQGLEAMLRPWPVLLDHLERLASRHQQAMADVRRHLAEDAATLRLLVPGWHQGVPPVTALRFGLSDPHGGGRTVGRIDFADGVTLAYKPRSLAVETAFASLLATLELDQRRLLVIDQGDHGWMEWLTHQPCRSRRQAAAFQRRCGELLAVLRCLRGGDIHPDNLIACGEYPVVVDLECLFQPAPEDLGIADPLLDPLAAQAGVLPVYTSFDGGQTLVPVAAAGTAVAATRSERRVVHSGTDWMHEAPRRVPAFDEAGPVLDGIALDVRDFAAAFAAGYRRGLAALALWPDAVEIFRGVPVRFLAAPTNLYALVLDGARAPACLADPAAQSQALARGAARPPLLGDAAAWTAVLAAEAEALDRLDVPAFRFAPDQRSLTEAGGRVLPDALPRPVLERVRQDLAGLTPRAIRGETALVAAALRRPQPLTAAAVSPRAVLRAVVDRIDALAVPVDRGIAWVRLWEQIPSPVSPAGPGLCYGAGGIAVALAEAARVLDDDRLARRSLQALGPWRRADGVVLARRIGPGWGRGLGGLLAALAWCADRLERPGLLRDALRLAEGAAAALERAPGVPDVLDGAAGLAFGLAELHRRRPSAALAAALTACGQMILACPQVSGGRLSGFAGLSRSGLAGLSHGAAGMAAALAAIACATADSQWQDAAAAMLVHEDRLFDAGRGNWRHLGGGGVDFKSTWCHGAPGIALARHGIAACLPTLAQRLDASIATALATTRNTPLAEVDDLCCGEAGRIEILLCLAAGDGAAEQALAARLPDWAAGRVLTLAARAEAPEDPSLLRGLGGLAHVLVRHLAPEVAAPVLMPLTP